MVTEINLFKLFNIFFTNLYIDVKNWKMNTKFDVSNPVNDFKKSIKCPDLQTCKIEPGKEFYLSFPKNNIVQNANISNKQIIHTNSFRNESRNNSILHYIF